MNPTKQQASAELLRLFVAYPSINAYLRGVADASATFDAWTNMLLLCDVNDVRLVVDDMIAGKIAPLSEYQTKDEVAVNIRRFANAIRNDRVERDRVANLRSAANEPRSAGTGRLAQAVRLSDKVGKDCKNHQPPNCPNCRHRVDHVVDWMEGRSESHVVV